MNEHASCVLCHAQCITQCILVAYTHSIAHYIHVVYDVFTYTHTHTHTHIDIIAPAGDTELPAEPTKEALMPACWPASKALDCANRCDCCPSTCACDATCMGFWPTNWGWPCDCACLYCRTTCAACSVRLHACVRFAACVALAMSTCRIEFRGPRILIFSMPRQNCPATCPKLHGIPATAAPISRVKFLNHTCASRTCTMIRVPCCGTAVCFLTRLCFLFSEQFSKSRHKMLALLEAGAR
jgi:hypothetical protein